MPLPLLPDNEDAGEATAGAAPDVFGATDRVRVVRARVRLVTVPPRAPKMLRSSVTLRSSWWRFSRPKVDVEEFRRIPGAWEASEWREFWLITVNESTERASGTGIDCPPAFAGMERGANFDDEDEVDDCEGAS